MNYKFLFGPVASRRLGISLGIDLVPHKYCNLNCIYCESGKTTIHTNQRKEYVSAKSILKELDHYLLQNPSIDYITFSGAGEPTLNSGFELIVDHIKKKYPKYKLALITNAILFSNSSVFEAALKCDLVMPSIDTINSKTFAKLNRPENTISLDDYKQGFVDFGNAFRGKLWVEIFLLPNINDTDQEIFDIKDVLMKINPEKVQLNTLDRPGTIPHLKPLNLERLTEIKDLLKPLNAEIISRTAILKHTQNKTSSLEESIISTIKRRPCTLNDLVITLSDDKKNITNSLQRLLKDNQIVKEITPAGEFYKAR